MKQKTKQIPQEPQPVRIIIEFIASGITDPAIRFEEGVTPGQVRDAAFLLSAIAERKVHEQMQRQHVQDLQSKIVVPPGSMGGAVGRGQPL